MKHLRTLLLTAGLLLIITDFLSAQALTNVRLASGMTVNRHPISAGNLILQQTAEKDIRFSITNLSNTTISRSFKLYLLPQPSGTPVVLWQATQSFSANQTVAFDRNTHPDLGTVVTQSAGTYRLELRGADGSNLNLVTLTSPLVPHVNGTNPATIIIWGAVPPLSTVMETAGTFAVKHPVSIGNLTLQYQKEKNISFKITNVSSSAVNRAFRLYMIPLVPGPTTVVWERALSFNAGQTLFFDRNNSPELGAIVTEAPGQYKLELRGSNIPDVTTVAPTSPLVPVSGATNPVTITIVECPDDYLAISPTGPINLCFGQTQTLTTGFSPNFTYQWRKNGVNITGANVNTYTVTGSGSYDVVITKSGCPSYIPAAVSVTIQPQITPTIAGLNAQYSNQDPAVTLTGSPSGGTFSGNGMNGNIFDPNTAGAGTHTITYSGTLNGCPYSVSQDVTVIDCPGQIVIAPGGPINLCPGEEIILNVPNDPSFSYQWRNDGVVLPGQTTASYVANTTGKYEVLITKPGCTPYLTPQVIVTMQPVITPSITGITPTVSNQSAPITLTGSPSGGTFSGNGIVGTTFDPVLAGIGTHTITYAGTLNGCPYTTSISVTVIACPPLNSAITPAGPHNLCFGQNIALSVPANPLFSFQWRRNGVNIPFATNANYTATQTGTYDVVISRTGCTSVTTPTVSVTVQGAITASITGLASQYTNQAPAVTMGGSPAGGTFMGPGVVGNTFNPAIAGVGTHVITYSGTFNGCPYSTTVQVTVVPCVNAVAITPPGPISVCFGGNVTLNAPNDPTYSYQWQRDNVNIPGATSRSYTATQSGNYRVVVTQAGCASVTSNVVQVTVQPQITPRITGLDTVYLVTAPPAVLTGTPAGGTFSGPGIVGNTFSPALAGVGTHIITYSGTLNGCPYSTTARTRVRPAGCSNPIYDTGSRSNNGDFYAIADINNDGLKDMLTANIMGILAIYINNGTAFNTGIPILVPANPVIRLPYIGTAESENLHYYDFDNDGAKDLLISFADPSTCSGTLVRIYWGTLAPPYFSALSFTNLAVMNNSCSVGYATDFNNDGKRDVFIESFLPGGERMYRNNGARNFTAVTPTAATSQGVYHVVKDWDGNGTEDLLSVDLNYGDPTYGLLFFAGIGNGNYVMPPLLHYRNEEPAVPHLSMQANPLQDNRLDIVFSAYADGTNGTRLYTGTWNPGIMNFSFRTQNILPQNASLLNILDANRDGFQDIIIQYYIGQQANLAAILNDGNGNFSAPRLLAQSTRYSFQGVFDFGDQCYKALGTSSSELTVFNVDINNPPIQVRSENLDNEALTNLTVYPNPTNGALSVALQLAQTAKVQVQINDLTGRTVQSHDFNGEAGDNTFRLDLTGQVSGVYILQVVAGNEKRMMKIILE
jgi:hypothetical protein